MTLKNYPYPRIPLNVPPGRNAAKVKVIVRVLVTTPTLMPPITANTPRDGVRGMSGREYTRELVRIRDGHTCQGCGKAWVVGRRRLDIHHLGGLCGRRSMGYDKISDAQLLITLCHRCHYNHHQFRLGRTLHGGTSRGNGLQQRGRAV